MKNAAFIDQAQINRAEADARKSADLLNAFTKAIAEIGFPVPGSPDEVRSVRENPTAHFRAMIAKEIEAPPAKVFGITLPFNRTRAAEQYELPDLSNVTSAAEAARDASTNFLTYKDGVFKLGAVGVNEIKRLYSFVPETPAQTELTAALQGFAEATNVFNKTCVQHGVNPISAHSTIGNIFSFGADNTVKPAKEIVQSIWNQLRSKTG